MRIILFTGLILLLNLGGKAQQVNTNEVIFAEFLIGGSAGAADGFTLGGSLNFQKGKHFFTFRAHLALQSEIQEIVPLVLYLPKFHQHFREYGLLYGWRFNNDGGRSLSFSLGVSSNLARHIYPDTSHNYRVTHEHSVGLPFEANVKFFKPNRSRYRLYFIIPVGAPTAFGRSIGFKFFGNVSQYSNFGFGITYSLGTHKEYYR